MYILVVEDDQQIRDSLRYVLELESYDVRAASNGKEALEILKKEPKPCLILLDLMMPVMDGWTVARHLSENAWLATIPVVVVTALSEHERPFPPAHAVLRKPLSLGALLEIVSNFCERVPPP